MPTPRIALVTDGRSAALDEDLPPLLAALDGAGVATCWDDPAVDWAGFDLAVIRSPWDYIAQLDAFRQWAATTATVTRLVNRPAVVSWNADKRYLADLHRVGLPIVPTSFVAPGVREWGLPAGRDLVVKPAVSSGSRDTARYPSHRAQDAVDHVTRLLGEGRAVMVQPYLQRIDTDGETALVFIDGQLSHTLRKGPLLDGTAEMVAGLFLREDISPRQPTVAQQELAEATMAAIADRFGPLLYGRVDLVPHDDGRPVILEVELIEPSLFHAAAPGSADRFAAAIRRWAAR